jgi:uncharacterized membrane protein
MNVKKISLILQSLFYMAAGLNHFVNPGFYLDLIPPYFPFKEIINHASGVVEMLLGTALFITATRRFAAWALIIMLVAFIPSHVYFIQIGGCVEGGLCTGLEVAWIRLLLIHPLLILWAWYHRS